MSDDDLTAPIVAAVLSGNVVDAERLCRQRLERMPDHANLLLLLGIILQRQRRFGDALAPYIRLTELAPDNSMHWANYATALKLAGDRDGAEWASERAVHLAPDEPDRLEQLGLLRLQLGKFIEARDILLRAFGKAPDSASVRIHAARACIACRDSRADNLLRPWREWLPLPDDQQCELADMLTQIGEMRDAVELLEDLLYRSPGDSAAQLLLAKSYERINRIDQAQALLDRIMATGAAADSGVRREVAAQRAQLSMRKYAYSDARRLLDQIGPGSDSDYGHFFSLAKACDKLGDHAAAMRALGTAHELQVEEIGAYASHLFREDTPPLPHANDRLAEPDYRTWPELKTPDQMQSPVFVVGFPRSGTTLLEQMLDAHPRLQSMDERPFLHMLADQLEDIHIRVPEDLHKLGQRDCDELRKGYVTLACGKVPRRWDARLVDKNPLNMLWLPMIHRMFPRAKFILALRHPCDIILSCYMQNFRAAPLAAASRSLQRLAAAYVAAMDNWLYHCKLIQPEVFISRYEDLVADTAAHTRRMADFLDLGNAEAMLQYDARAREKGFIATPSYTEVIEPINRKGIDRWQHYREYFEPALPILAPMLEHWGYSIHTDMTAGGADGSR
jgi:Flp pilus assembly protein TadD